jgi:hypothetical protein
MTYYINLRTDQGVPVDFLTVDEQAFAILATAQTIVRYEDETYRHVGAGSDGEGNQWLEFHRSSLVSLIKLSRNSEPIFYLKERKPVAWLYEQAQAREYADGFDKPPTGWSHWSTRLLSFTKPNVPDGSIRNLTPLYE